MTAASKLMPEKRGLSLFACLAFAALAARPVQAETANTILFEGLRLKNECAPMEGVGPDYPLLACAGQKALMEHRFERAAEAFEEALSLDVHEFPNNDLYPKLALAQLLGGDRDAAERSLSVAHLAYSVELGLIKCPGMDGPKFRYEGPWVPRVEQLGRETVDVLIWPFCEAGSGFGFTDLDVLPSYMLILNDYFAVKEKETEMIGGEVIAPALAEDEELVICDGAAADTVINNRARLREAEVSVLSLSTEGAAFIYYSDGNRLAAATVTYYGETGKIMLDYTFAGLASYWVTVSKDNYSLPITMEGSRTVSTERATFQICDGALVRGSGDEKILPDAEIAEAALVQLRAHMPE